MFVENAYKRHRWPHRTHSRLVQQTGTSISNFLSMALADSESPVWASEHRVYLKAIADAIVANAKRQIRRANALQPPANFKLVKEGYKSKKQAALFDYVMPFASH